MYERILVPLDGSDASERGLREAISWAAMCKGRLHLLHVVEAFPMVVEMAAVSSAEAYRRHVIRAGEVLLERARGDAEREGVSADIAVREVTRQPIAEAILEEARRAGCNLVVMGSHGRRGLTRWTLGSDAERVVRASHVPVLVVHEQKTLG